MRTGIANYQIVVDKEGKKYNAYCPSLGLADWGESVEEAVENIKETIKFHLESLEEEGEKLPLEIMSMSTSVSVPFRNGCLAM